VTNPATSRPQTVSALSQRFLAECFIRDLCVGSVGLWAVGVPLDQISSAYDWESLMGDWGHAERRVGGRVCTRHWDAFNQDDWTARLRRGEHIRQRGSFKPPDRPRLD
jgi:hypothetical protein